MGCELESWRYADVKAADVRSPRVFRFKVAQGKSFSCYPVGGERQFEQTLGTFLREKNQGAKVKM